MKRKQLKLEKKRLRKELHHLEQQMDAVEQRKQTAITNYKEQVTATLQGHDGQSRTSGLDTIYTYSAFIPMTNEAIIDSALKLYRELPHYPDYVANGKVSINTVVIPKGEPIQIVNYRHAILQHKKPLSVRLDQPYRYHELKQADYGTWMTTHLMEIAQMVPIVKSARGNILVGGLGLGVVAHAMNEKSSVRKVTVVEIDSNVIALIKPLLHPSIEIVQADLMEFAKQIKPDQYHYAFFDVWQRPNQTEWIETVVPLRRLLIGKIPRMDFWQEDEMIGDVEQGLGRAAVTHASLYKGQHLLRHYYAFRKVMETLFPAKITEDMSQEESMKATLDAETEYHNNPLIRKWGRMLTRKVGTPEWDNAFGKNWDETPAQRFEDQYRKEIVA